MSSNRQNQTHPVVDIDAIFWREMARLQEYSESSSGWSDGFAAALQSRFDAGEAQLFRTGPVDGPLKETIEVALSPENGELCLNSAWPAKWRHIYSAPFDAGGDCAGVVQLAFGAPRNLSASEADLLKTAAEYAGSALARLDNEVLFRQSSMSLLQLEEIERKRISRDLHDDAAQSLAVIRLQLEMIEMSAPPESDDLRARLAEAREVAEKTIISMRRMISDLSPAILEQLGLAAAVRQLANRLRTSAGCNVTLEIAPFAPLQPYKQLVLYRVVQQCFANIAQHSSARNINLSLSEADGVLRLDVEDDGVGFSVQERLGHPECFGLQGMRDRVYLIGGKFLVESTPKQGKTRSTKSRSGTRISVEVPADKGHK